MDADTKVIKDWLKQHQISEVECLVPDITGNARGKFIPANQFLAGGEPRRLTYNVGFDGLPSLSKNGEKKQRREMFRF